MNQNTYVALIQVLVNPLTDTLDWYVQLARNNLHGLHFSYAWFHCYYKDCWVVRSVLSFIYVPAWHSGLLGANTCVEPTNSTPQRREWGGQNQPSYVKADVLINQHTHCTSPNLQAITLAPTRKHVFLPSSNAHSRKQNPSQLPWGWSLLFLSKHSHKYLLKGEE